MILNILAKTLGPPKTLRLDNPALAKIVESFQKDRACIDSSESVVLKQSQCITTIVAKLEASKLALEQCISECRENQKYKSDL